MECAAACCGGREEEGPSRVYYCRCSAATVRLTLGGAARALLLDRAAGGVGGPCGGVGPEEGPRLVYTAGQSPSCVGRCLYLIDCERPRVGCLASSNTVTSLFLRALGGVVPPQTRALASQRILELCEGPSKSAQHSILRPCCSTADCAHKARQRG